MTCIWAEAYLNSTEPSVKLLLLEFPLEFPSWVASPSWPNTAPNEFLFLSRWLATSRSKVSVFFIKLCVSIQTFYKAKHRRRRATTRRKIWKAFWETNFFNKPLVRWNDVSDPMTWPSIQWHDVHGPIEWCTIQWHEFRFNNTNVVFWPNDVLQWHEVRSNHIKYMIR